MEAQIIKRKSRQFVRISPTPTRDISAALWCRYDRDTETQTDMGYTDIKAGQSDYDLPSEPRKVIEVWIEEDK